MAIFDFAKNRFRFRVLRYQMPGSPGICICENTKSAPLKKRNQYLVTKLRGDFAFMFKQSVTSEELSTFLGVAPRVVHRLTKRGVFLQSDDRYSLDTSLQKYSEWIEDKPIHSAADLPCIKCGLPPGYHDAIVWSRSRGGLLIMDIRCPFCHAEYKRQEIM